MKIMLVDDHPLFLEGLQYLLKTYDIPVADVANSGREAFKKAHFLHPDIILMDIKMPGFSGIDALKLIKAEMPYIKIAMLTASESDEDLFEAIKYGASGYLLKSTNAKELVEMLHDLENGEAHFTPEIAAQMLEEFKFYDSRQSKDISQTAQQLPELTQRQLEILEMVSRGITYKEAGEMLGLTERTLKYHMGRIIDIFHLENRSQVIAYAVRMGIIKDSNSNE